MWKFVYIIAGLIFNLIVSSQTARILAVFPTPSISHQVVFRPLTQELAKHGHEVIVITTDPVFSKGQTPANLTEIDVHDVSYNIWRQFTKLSTGIMNDSFKQMEVAFDLVLNVFSKQLENKEIKKLVQDKDTKFDLLLIEACVRPALVLSHIFKTPVILMSSFGSIYGNNEVIGAPNHPILYPLSLRRRLYNMTIWEKVKELYNDYYLKQTYENLEIKENEVIKSHFGPDVPTLKELSNNVNMLFLNIHPIWEGNRPVPPGVIYMGGMHQIPEKPLPMDLKSYLDSSVNGVIYISYGTNVVPSMLPPEKIQMLIKVFSQLPYDVLWKWDKDELPGRSKNIKIAKWLPQSDLLRHPKVKLFITQGGLQSTDEAITAGVPLIGMPVLGDQWYNVEKYVYHKIGVKLEMESVTEEAFRDAIHTVIGDESYRRNIVRLGTLMRDQPQRPLERAVWWTEHVLRHGGARHLRAPAANISWSEYLELELVSVLLLGSFTVISLLITSLYVLLKYVANRYRYVIKIKSN